MIKLHSGDLHFLRDKAVDFSNIERILPIFHKIYSAKQPERDIYEFELNEEELEIIEDYLSSLISVGEDGEIDSTGRRADNLIDVFKIFSE
ncbi:MAG TPA: hypothetical protein VEX64_03150 [Pyrinomonadaceae bacterium]|jgi:hypothetical protein|nr:hypothetical protein [Pyrinomonadaceae bacterium]